MSLRRAVFCRGRGCEKSTSINDMRAWTARFNMDFCTVLCFPVALASLLNLVRIKIVLRSFVWACTCVREVCWKWHRFPAAEQAQRKKASDLAIFRHISNKNQTSPFNSQAHTHLWEPIWMQEQIFSDYYSTIIMNGRNIREPLLIKGVHHDFIWSVKQNFFGVNKTVRCPFRPFYWLRIIYLRRHSACISGK